MSTLTLAYKIRILLSFIVGVAHGYSAYAWKIGG